MRLPDLRFVYYDWGSEPLRRFDGGKPCRWHRWTTISPEVIRAARRAGLGRPTWYAGPTCPAYCGRCGVIADQREARLLRWRVMSIFAGIDERAARHNNAANTR